MMKNMGRKEDSNGYSREVSNNILVLILIVIIFVSVLGTMIVKQTIDTMKSVRSTPQQPSATRMGNTGMIALTVLPSEESAGRDL
ncbi:MAG: hypothetical protein AABX72_01480 [Nanoarchaeota archaeon]